MQRTQPAGWRASDAIVMMEAALYPSCQATPQGAAQTPLPRALEPHSAPPSRALAGGGSVSTSNWSRKLHICLHARN